MNNQDKFRSDLLRVYSYKKLHYLYNNYFYKLEKYISSKTYFYNEVIDPKTDKNNYEYMANFIFYIFSDKNLFLRFIDLFSPKFKKIFGIVVNAGNEVSITTLSEKLKEKINIKLSGDIKSYDDNLLNFLFNLTQVNSIYFVSLPETIKEVLRNYLQNPENEKLNPVKIDTKNSNLIIYKGNQNVLKELKEAILYLENFQIKFSSSNNLSKSEIFKIGKTLKFEEFYKQDSLPKDLKYLKTELLITLLLNITYKTIDKQNSIDLLKAIINEYQNPKTHFYSYILLFHVRFSSFFLNSQKDYLKNSHFHQTIIKLITSLPKNEWISFENIFDYVIINNYFIKLITEFTARDFYVTPFGVSKSDKIYIRDSKLYSDLIIVQAIKASLFLFSALGLIDIAYELPKNSNEENNYLSPFDGLKYIKINDLGLYILGLSEHYDYSSINQQETNIILDSKRLIIKLSNPDNLKAGVISNFAKQINEKTFIIDSSYFLNGCLNKKDIDDKIRSFKRKISKDLPQIWEDFFESLNNKSSILFEEQKNYIIYKVPDNKEIVDLIYTDEILSKTITKMENFQIAIKSEDITTVKNRFKYFGYFL